jgi:RNA polymerase sigma-70 factor, ECF subfamily
MEKSVSDSDTLELTFRSLFTRHYGRLLAFALRRTSEPADAQDVVGETFAVAWRRMDQLPAPEFEVAWLYGIAGRVLANQRRSQRRLAALRVRLRSRISDRPPVEDIAATREEWEHILATLHQLSSRDQEILRLFAWEGLTQRELAVALRCSENAAAIRLHRARKRLVERLAKETPLPGHSVLGGKVQDQEVSR